MNDDWMKNSSCEMSGMGRMKDSGMRKTEGEMIIQEIDMIKNTLRTMIDIEERNEGMGTTINKE